MSRGRNDNIVKTHIGLKTMKYLSRKLNNNIMNKYERHKKK